jgi:hypothetical protein
MRKLPCIIAAAALSGLTLGSPAVANPLAVGLAGGSTAVTELNEGLVQKVHGWHCRARKGWYHGHKRWHRHRRACYDYDDYDDYDDDYGYGYGYGGYPYGGYPYGYGYSPFVLGFSFGDNHRRHRRHHHNW